MVDVKQGKTFRLTAPFVVTAVDGSILNPDSTLPGSQSWVVTIESLVTLSSQADGSALLVAAIDAAVGTQVVVTYTGKATDATGSVVDDMGTETYNIIAADVVVPPTPVTVAITSTEVPTA